MVWSAADTDDPALLPLQRTLRRCFAAHPVIGEINLVAAWLMELLGPMMWAALILLSLWAEIGGPS
jgi:hypothetical protein